MHWADLALIVTVVFVGCAATYVALLRAMRRIFSEREARMTDQLTALGDAVGSLETRMNAHAIALEAQKASEAAAVPDAGMQPGNPSPRIRAAIAAAATAFFGRSAVVRSVKPAAPDAVSPWSQQGRLLVQTSHNLRSRR